MPVTHSYKIFVEYNRLNELNAKTTSTLFVTASTADLAVLLHALDASASVAGITVFATLTFPNLHTYNKLTSADLGITEITKLK